MLPCAGAGRKIRLDRRYRPPRCPADSNRRGMDRSCRLVGSRRGFFEAALHYYSDLPGSLDTIPTAALRLTRIPDYYEPRFDALYGQDFVLVLSLAANLPGYQDAKLGTLERIPVQSHRSIDSRGSFLSICGIAVPPLERTLLGSDRSECRRRGDRRLGGDYLGSWK